MDRESKELFIDHADMKINPKFLILCNFYAILNLLHCRFYSIDSIAFCRCYICGREKGFN